MRRGEIYYIVPPRAFGKQRPALVVQAGLFLPNASCVTFCLLTGSIQFTNPIRILVTATKTNGLTQSSLIQVDKLISVEANRIRNRLGMVTRAQLARVDAALKLWLELT